MIVDPPLVFRPLGSDGFPVNKDSVVVGELAPLQDEGVKDLGVYEGGNRVNDTLLVVAHQNEKELDLCCFHLAPSAFTNCFEKW